MKHWKLLLPVLALLAFGVVNADEKKASLSYYYIDG